MFTAPIWTLPFSALVLAHLSPGQHLTDTHASVEGIGFAAAATDESEPAAMLQTKMRRRVQEQAMPSPTFKSPLSAADRILVEASGGLHLSELLEEHTLEELQMEEALSEKHGAATIDCADEVLLRLAITESLYSPSYDACVEKLTNSTFAKGGSGADMTKPKDNGGSGMTRQEVEQRIRERCITRQGHGVALGPRLIRMTFHDAADYNNSLLQNGTELPIDQTGVDACLRTALLSVGLSNEDDDDNLDDIAKGDPNHNRGLQNAVRWVLHMSSASKLSRPDMMVLGAVTAMEAWMGMSELGFRFGRTPGDCQKIVCTHEDCWGVGTPFFKQPVAESVGSGMFCPMTNTLDPLRKVIGLSMAELVALQGAHSVGGVIVCSGLGNVANAPYCPKKCGIPPGSFWETGNLDGTSFDDTPGKMDNRYYQLLMGEEYEELPACSEADSYLPRLSKRGLKEKKNLTETCAAGVKYEPENACEVEACEQSCSSSESCMQAENTENDDLDEFREAWEDCLMCKKLCSGSHSRKIAQDKFRTELNACKAKCKISDACNKTVNANWDRKDCVASCDKEVALCKTAAAGADWQSWKRKTCNEACKADSKPGWKDCNAKKGKERRKCRAKVRSAQKECFAACKKKGVALQNCNVKRKPCVKECNDMQELKKQCNRCVEDVCKPQATALKESIYNTSGQKVRPASWCKRLSDTKKCLDPSVKMPINGGWGDCPEEQRMTFPNTGAGRLTIVQNLDRWTKFRGLFKRVMVLPSDWSYLGKKETKELFKKYGTDEQHWKDMYSQAWKKISELGWKDSLNQCSKVSCSVTGGSISCPVQAVGIGNAQNKKATNRMQKARKALGLPEFVRPSKLVFEAAKCDPPVSAQSCELVGGWGVKAKFSCGGQLSYCSTSAAAATETRIEEEWKSSGGQQPTCDAEVSKASAMLATDVAVGLRPDTVSPSSSHETEDGTMLLQSELHVEDRVGVSART